MDTQAITRALAAAFPGLDVVEADGDFYYFVPAAPGVTADHKFPFATLVTSNRHDPYSALDRPGVFRLNVGVKKETYLSLFGEQKLASDENSIAASGYDFAALDMVLPHPVYGRMWWVCVVSPSAATFERIRPLIAESYALAERRQA